MEHSKQELELIKLKEEIKNLRKPFYKRPEFLSIILSSLFAAVTIFISIRTANKEALDELKSRNIELSNKINDFDRKNLEIDKAALETSVSNLQLKEKNLKDSLFINYNRDLLELERKMEDIFDYYIQDYSIGYANTYVKSKQVNGAIGEFIVKGKEADFKKWLYASTRRAIDKSNRRSMEQVLNNIGFELKLNQYKK